MPNTYTNERGIILLIGSLFIFKGSVLTILFGCLHFSLPRLFNWEKYLKALPRDIARGLLSTNYILGIILCLIGVFSIVAYINIDSKNIIFKFWMSIMVTIWLCRLIFHFKYPLGKFLGIYKPMVLAFLFTTFCFLSGTLMIFIK